MHVYVRGSKICPQLSFSKKPSNLLFGFKQMLKGFILDSVFIDRLSFDLQPNKKIWMLFWIWKFPLNKHIS